MARRSPLALLLRFATLQIERPVWVLLGVLATLIPAGWAASRLELRTSFSELLPEDKPSVIELHRVEERLAGNTTLTVVAEGNKTEALKRFVDALSPKLRALGPAFVASVEDGNRDARAFFKAHKHLYADLPDLQKLRDQVIERYDWEVGRAAGMDLGLDEEEPPELSANSIEALFKKKLDQAEKASPGVDGYYIGEGGKLAVVLVRTPFGTGDQRAFGLRRKIQSVVNEVNPKRFDPSIHVSYTGNLITSAEQHQAITADLTQVGAWGIALILSVVYLFFIRVRTLMAMTLTIGVGCVWAFGFAYLSVGYLNTATGFLFSIIAGNGINFGIIYMARYIETRREGSTPAQAVRIAHESTAVATLAVAAAAMVAYGSLASTNFRGFKHFGIIGGTGMILCWIATYITLPAILIVTERYKPMFRHANELGARLRGFYGYPFAFLARRYSRTLALIGLASGIGAGVLSAKYFLSDPMEYNLRKVRNELKPTSAGQMSFRVDKVVGREGQDRKAIVVDRIDQVKPLIQELKRRKEAAPENDQPFSKVVSIYDLLPDQQTEKIGLLADIKDRIERARRRGFIKDADWEKIREHIPERLAPIGIDDLPDSIARPFMERDGTRGRIVYIVPTPGKSVYDAKYLRKWADSFREVELPKGEIVRGTGDPVIFTDMLIAVGEDAPKAIFMSFIGTVLVVLFAFRFRKDGFIALATLALGLSWMLAFLYVKDVKLNFLNFVALPITIGVGADYAVNVMKRRQLEGDERLYRVFIETGGAVVLCSLTTTLGYVALLLSVNRAVQSFGLAAAAGEVTTLMSAMLILPAVLFWRVRANGKAAREATST